MPTTAANGVEVPVGSDAYNLVADLLRMAKSMKLVIPVASAAERDNLADKYEGLTVIRTDQGGIQQTYSGGAWYGFRSASAGLTVPIVAAGGSYGVDITYPTGIFPGTPRTTATGPSSRLTVGVSNMTATGCRLTFDNVTSAASSSGMGVWHATYGIV